MTDSQTYTTLCFNIDSDYMADDSDMNAHTYAVIPADYFCDYVNREEASPQCTVYY